jgi:hypothetical protein
MSFSGLGLQPPLSSPQLLTLLNFCIHSHPWSVLLVLLTLCFVLVKARSKAWI